MQSASSGLCAACSPDVGWHAQRSGMPRLASSSLSTIRSRESFIFPLIHEKTLPSLAAPPPRSCSRVSVLCSCASSLCACVLPVPGRQELAGAPTRPARPLAVTSLPSGGAGSHARGRRAADRPIGIPRRAAPSQPALPAHHATCEDDVEPASAIRQDGAESRYYKASKAGWGHSHVEKIIAGGERNGERR